MPFSGDALRSGIRQDQLRLLYQPLLNAHSAALAGVEALVRWQHPDRGLLGPDVFLPAIERNGLMTGLTDWVIEEALTQCASWRQTGMIVPVSVNLSATLLDDHKLVERVLGMAVSCGVPAPMLTLEITETALSQHSGSAADIITAFRMAGVRISVDDFGTGYTSLAMLKDHTFDEVKIDRSFVDAMKHSPADEAIVRAILELGHRLGLEVVAEGVEDASTARLLAELGCDILQGYHFARPLTANALTAYAEAEKESRLDRIPPEQFAVLAAGHRPSGAVAAPLPDDEATRLALLEAFDVLDSAPDRVLDDLVKIAAAICGTPTALLTFVDKDRQWFKARTGLDIHQTPREDAFCAHAILTPTEIMEVPDARSDERFATNPLVTGAPHIRFYAGSPLLTADGHALGTLCVLDCNARTLDASQRDSLTMLSRMAVQYLQTIRAQEVTERMLSVINSLARMHSSDDLSTACMQVANAARELCQASGVALMLTDKPGSVRYRSSATVTDDPDAAALIADTVLDSRGNTALGVIRSTNAPLFIADTATSQHVQSERAERLGAASVFYVPVTAQTGVLGALVIWWSTPQAAPDLTRAAVLGALATQVGATVSRLNAVAGIRDAADTDLLTGLANRRYFLTTLTRLPDDSAVILLELDSIGRTNNDHGHHAGDQLLKAFSAHLRAASRATDVIARWSGTKFAVALAGQADGAIGFTDRVRRSWSETIGSGTFTASHVTVARHETPTAAISRVSEALQRAKHESQALR